MKNRRRFDSLTAKTIPFSVQGKQIPGNAIVPSACWISSGTSFRTYNGSELSRTLGSATLRIHTHARTCTPYAHTYARTPTRTLTSVRAYSQRMNCFGRKHSHVLHGAFWCFHLAGCKNSTYARLFFHLIYLKHISCFSSCTYQSWVKIKWKVIKRIRMNGKLDLTRLFISV